MNPICIHGHFYQPSREDPFTLSIPDEIGAEPYPNWNEKINANCYFPNAKLRNFEHISFDIGPTLWNWMERYASETYRMIIEQESIVFNEFGVSNCLMQPYHHTILPLSNRDDKVTQIRWGIWDYKMRLGHLPQGAWLPETAVDLETIEILIQEGIQFTILAPWQIKNGEEGIPTIYKSNYGELIIFPYNKEISASFSFDPSKTTNADSFSRWLEKNHFLRAENHFPIIATDGELYGHHQPFRDYFLQRLFNVSLHQAKFFSTFPALWLTKGNMVQENAELIENTSWSCPHGIERWKGSCGCTYNGEWKHFLREGLKQIALELDKFYFQELSNQMDDPFKLRHEYIRVITGNITLQELLEELDCRNCDSNDLKKIELLLQAQVERQRMFTSCGWFFEDFARIEPVNNIKYATKAVWLTYIASGYDISTIAYDCLIPVSSWRMNLNGGEVFRKQLEKAKQLM